MLPQGGPKWGGGGSRPLLDKVQKKDAFFCMASLSLKRIGLCGWLEQYEWHNNLVVGEESLVPKFILKSLKNAIHGVLLNLKYFEKSCVLTDNKNLVWGQLYFSGPLSLVCGIFFFVICLWNFLNILLCQYINTLGGWGLIRGILLSRTLK